MPIEHDLACPLAILLRELLDERLLEHIQVLVLLALEGPRKGTQRRVGCHLHAQLLLEIHEFFLHKIWMKFNLVNYWLNFSIGKDIKKHGNGAVADTNTLSES